MLVSNINELIAAKGPQVGFIRAFSIPECHFPAGFPGPPFTWDTPTKNPDLWVLPSKKKREESSFATDYQHSSGGGWEARQQNMSLKVWGCSLSTDVGENGRTYKVNHKFWGCFFLSATQHNNKYGSLFCTHALASVLIIHGLMRNTQDTDLLIKGKGGKKR